MVPHANWAGIGFATVSLQGPALLLLHAFAVQSPTRMRHRLTKIYTRTGDTGPKDRAACFATSAALIAAT
jgi:hypothetical protein